MAYSRKTSLERIKRIRQILEEDPDASVTKIARILGVREKNARAFMARNGLQTKGMKKYAGVPDDD